MCDVNVLCLNAFGNIYASSADKIIINSFFFTRKIVTKRNFSLI